jgi:predicted transcriptional regulator
MSMTVQLSADIEAKLRQLAALLGKQPDGIALEAIEEKLNGSIESVSPLSRDEWHRRFDALLASMPPGNLDADLSRKSVYDGRGL